MKQPPLVVDLDGTLLYTDTLYESLMIVIKRKAIALILLPFWLLRGRAYVKKKISAIGVPNSSLLPYNWEFITWLKEQRNSGRELILCSAADQRIVDSVAKHLGLFDQCMSSDGVTNLKGSVKADALLSKFSESGFSYAGDSRPDLKVWQVARSAVVVSSSKTLMRSASLICPIERQFKRDIKPAATAVKLIRAHQWAKNLLVFVPAIASHQIAHLEVIFTLTVAFLSFSLCSSSVYVTNDLLDLEHDRRHPRKRNRPLASGKLSLLFAGALAPTLLGISWLIALSVSKDFAFVLATYYAVSCAYSFILKRLVLLDCLVLASLYTLRVIAGAAAISINTSFWLLTFSVFLFLSLAFVKRFVELQELSETKKGNVLSGRNYSIEDKALIQILGVTSGFLSTLVLALYIDSTASGELYSLPEMVWGAVGIVLFWINWIWLKANRKEMHDDPVVFAITDTVSLVCGITFGIVVLLGITGFPPWS